MLVLRYFFYVGGALLALLLLFTTVMPKAPADDGAVASASDTPAIRIHSVQKWPDRVVLDTNAPLPEPAKVAQSPAPAEPQANGGVREAYAQLPPDEPKPQTVAEAKKPDPKPVVKRKVARARTAPQQFYPQPYYGYPQYQQGRMQMAQQPHFGFLW
jgi:hypothetical protein